MSLFSWLGCDSLRVKNAASFLYLYSWYLGECLSRGSPQKILEGIVLTGVYMYTTADWIETHVYKEEKNT